MHLIEASADIRAVNDKDETPSDVVYSQHLQLEDGKTASDLWDCALKKCEIEL